MCFHLHIHYGHYAPRIHIFSCLVFFFFLLFMGLQDCPHSYCHAHILSAQRQLVLLYCQENLTQEKMLMYILRGKTSVTM